MHQTYLYFHVVLGILDVLQRCINVQRHHQARGELQRVVRLPRWLYDSGRCPMNLTISRATSTKNKESTSCVQKKHTLTDSSYLFRQPELQQAALSQSRLEDLHHLHWFTGREPGHQLQELVHKAVLQVGQLGPKQPEGCRKYERKGCRESIQAY